MTSIQVGDLFHRDHSEILSSRQAAAVLLREDGRYQMLHARVQDSLHALA